MSKEEARAAAIPVFDEELRVKKTIKETDRVFIWTSALRSEEVSLERQPPADPTTSQPKED